MVIRFLCPACSQPIEVDDVWASKLVACPYCRKTVVAPAESTLPDPSRVPLAEPVFGPAGDSSAVAGTAAPPAHSPLAIAAFVLACLQVIFFLTINGIVAVNHLEAGEFFKAVEGKSIMEIQAYVQQRGGMPGWMVSVVVLEVGMAGAWLATVACGLIALARSARRGLAVAALVITAALPVLVCLGAPLTR